MASTLKEKLYDIIFEADTRAGKAFDIVLLIIILLSVGIVMLESVSSFEQKYGALFSQLEWIITAIFSIEYIIRLWIVRKPSTYAFSFFGIIDLLAILPSFLGLVLVGGHGLMVIRALRLLRVFRILKLTRYTKEGKIIINALANSRAKIGVFLFGILMIVIVIGTIMYLVEGYDNGFTSIPRSIYWAVVTLTTVGYGDISPQTPFGQLIAGFVMVLGYAIIAVPTGIVTVELSKKKKITTQVCPECLKEGHDPDAICCKYCGSELN